MQSIVILRPLASYTLNYDFLGKNGGSAEVATRSDSFLGAASGVQSDGSNPSRGTAGVGKARGRKGVSFSRTGSDAADATGNKGDQKGARMPSRQWTEEEDQKLIQLYSRIGNKWAQMTKYLPTRTEHAIKQRFNVNLKQRGQWQRWQKPFICKTTSLNKN